MPTTAFDFPALCDFTNEAPDATPEELAHDGFIGQPDEETAHLGCAGVPSFEDEPDPDDARQLERDFHLD